MNSFSDFMGGDHSACDALYAEAERAVDSGDWNVAGKANDHFLNAMERHFNMEEQVLFAAFEAAQGSTMGPTQVMRHEHSQMRQLFQQMRDAVAEKDVDAYLGAGETLLILMQQHNSKEEQILYPMTDQVLAAEREELFKQMEAVTAE
ncbi:hemerythrin domain-containing protein [Thiohalomonas denitrificans]|uniref:hemerythrin domain-containing protein n=1 Tax=Thiohalomonas denitrificans TaxID=415747 RepID=UPI0026ED6C14|nr:hemerythrin domain-containing protein [Thiohalomonas denitrificans]